MFLLILVQDADGDMPQSLYPKLVTVPEVGMYPKLVCAVDGVCAASDQMRDLC